MSVEVFVETLTGVPLDVVCPGRAMVVIVSFCLESAVKTAVNVASHNVLKV